MQYDYDWEILGGTHYEIGVQHGHNNAERMSYLLNAFHVDLSQPWREADLLKPLEKHLPGLADEIHGIAAGSGLSLREVCALSFLVDLGTTTAACTGIAFADGPDGPVVGKTSDCTPGVQQEWLRPRWVRPKGEFAAIAHSHVGSPNAEMGMNERGLAIGISGLGSLATNPNGVGWQQDIRAILHSCATTEDAIDMLRSVPIRRAGYAAIIGDAEGDIAVVEKIVGAVAVRRPEQNVIYEANVALTDEALPHTNPAWSGPNCTGRTALLHRLCAPGAVTDFSLQGMIDLFSTHAEPVGICQHGPELHSQTGFFMLPRKREIWIAKGYTCKRNLEVARV